MQIKYVGKRASFTDNLYGSRIFFPHGEVIEVPNAVAEKLLRHPEFSMIEKAPAEMVEKASAEPELDTPDIGEMNKAELDDYAKTLGIELDRRKSLGNMRKDFLALAAAR
jgi:hypothetical protein